MNALLCAQYRPSEDWFQRGRGLRLVELSVAGIIGMTLAHMGAFRSYPVLCVGFTLRACPAPCGRLALLLPLRGPPGYGFQLRRTLRKCRASTLGAGATRSLREG